MHLTLKMTECQNNLKENWKVIGQMLFVTFKTRELDAFTTCGASWYQSEA